MAGVAEQGDTSVHPGGERTVKAELPLADLTVQDEVQHWLDLGAEILKGVENGGFQALGVVGGRGWPRSWCRAAQLTSCRFACSTP